MRRKIKAKALSVEAFTPYGSYMSVITPEGYYLQGEYHKFYRDMVRFPVGGDGSICFSSLVVKKNAELIIKGMEYHDYTDEVQLPVDSDTVLVCAPANGGDIAIDEAEAFIVPKGTMICLRRGTWHDVMYPLDQEKVSVLIGLPERVYHNDIVVKSFSESEIQVEL